MSTSVKKILACSIWAHLYMHMQLKHLFVGPLQCITGHLQHIISFPEALQWAYGKSIHSWRIRLLFRRSYTQRNKWTVGADLSDLKIMAVKVPHISVFMHQDAPKIGFHDQLEDKQDYL